MRKQITYTVTAEGRDHGKIFQITEMPAAQAESWAFRAILALMNNGVELPDNFQNAGMAAMAEIGIRALSNLKWEVAEPLLTEMFTCLLIIPDASRPQVIRPLRDDDIEEIKTRITLRYEIWKLHTDFLKTAAS